MAIRLVLTALFTLAITVPVSAAQKSKKIQKEIAVEYESLGDKKIQTQKVEFVKAGPLKKPMSAKMRQKRQQLEMETEEKFVQKLEDARMEDERARRQELFEQQLRATNEFQDLESPNELATTLIINEEDDAYDYYVSLVGGGVNYPLVNGLPNMNGAGGLALGMGVGSDFWLEGSFLYSFQQVETSSFTGAATNDIDHLSFGVGAKYGFTLSKNWITPVAGVLFSYTRRQYDGGDNNSNALDGGLVGGLELALNKAVKLGLEGRYMMNLDYDKESAVSNSDIDNLEDFDYAVYLMTAKMIF